MHIAKATAEQADKVYAYLDKRAHMAGDPAFVKYLDLGTHVVRLISHSSAFIPHIEWQLDWSLRDSAERYDATLVIWQETSLANVSIGLHAIFDATRYRQLRANKLMNPTFVCEDFALFDQEIWRNHALVHVTPGGEQLFAWNPATNTHYYSVEKLGAEDIIKHGHLFVQTISKVLRSPTSNIAHGAVVGINETGVLLCGFGYRGKSTFSVNALLNGLDYVSDDYLVLGKQDGTLRAWPIYSIITLSPAVYLTMHPRLRQAEFVSNNARKDKYVFNISAYHDRFRAGYPVKMCMGLNFTKAPEPSIVSGGKEQAIQDLVMSTLRQMAESEDVMQLGKMYSFVEALPFFTLNLSKNIDKNTRCLKDFLAAYK